MSDRRRLRSLIDDVASIFPIRREVSSYAIGGPYETNKFARTPALP